MALRIGEFVLGGEFSNEIPNRVEGWLIIVPGRHIRVELTGNLTGEFKGRSFRFSLAQAEEYDPIQASIPEFIETLDEDQSGVVADFCFRSDKGLMVPSADLKGAEAVDASKGVQKSRLVLEWYGHLGRVVAELVDVEIEFTDQSHERPDLVTSTQLNRSDPEAAVSVTRVSFDDRGESTIEIVTDADADRKDDVDPDRFQPRLSELIGQSLDSSRQENVMDKEPSVVLPGGEESESDFMSRAQEMFERIEMIHREEDELPIGELLAPPLRLPHVDQVTTDEQAEPLVEMILDRLDEHAVAIANCDHATPLNKYRVIVNGILPNIMVSSSLKELGGTMNYCMWDCCPECIAELDADFEFDEDDTDE